MPAEVWWLSWPILTGVGLIVIMMVALRPSTFWAAVIIGNMIGNGPRTYTLIALDEIITGAAVLGALLTIALAKRSATRAVRRRVSGVHMLFFLLWIGYMLILSFVGIAATNDFRVIRWVLFYLLLVLCMAVSVRDETFPFPDTRRAWRLILVGALIAFGSYMVQGLYFENALGTEWARFENQDYFWAGSAYAVFPIVLGMPAALFFVRDRSMQMKCLAWTALVLYMAVGFYFLSRVTWMVMAAFIWTNVDRIGILRGATIAAAFMALFVTVGPVEMSNVPLFFGELLTTSQAFTNPEDSDVTRNLQIRAAFDTIADNWLTAITGSGIYTNRFRIAPHIVSLQAVFLDQRYLKQSLVVHRATEPSDSEGGRAVYRTTGFPALLIDTGIIGMFLFAANFCCAGAAVLRTRSPARRMLVLIPPIVFLWLFVTNTADIVLQYLLIMPHGLLIRLSDSDAPAQRPSGAIRCA